MRRLSMPLVIVATFLLFLPAPPAFADGCTDLGGVVDNGECQISGNVGNKSGTFQLDQPLHILDGGKIVVPPTDGGNSLTITVCAAPAVCSFKMDPDAEITGNVTKADTVKGIAATIDISATGAIVLAGNGNLGATISANQKAGSCSGGKGGSVHLTAAGSISTQAGSVISVDGDPCPAGDIELISAQGNVSVAGLLSATSTYSGTGAVQRPGGGPITVVARCNLTVDGTIQSKGTDAGADLIHLEGGCQVTVNGLVESTGDGHGVPNSPANHCGHPDKPKNSTACIEIWAGDGLLIGATGQLNADLGLLQNNEGISWIDLFARGNITINGPSSTSSPFAVHANGLGGSGGDGEEGGIIAVASKQGKVSASGRALQASVCKNAPGEPCVLTNSNNSDGGSITVKAALSVTFDGNTPTLEAKAKDQGGTITARAFTGALSWTNGSSDVR